MNSEVMTPVDRNDAIDHNSDSAFPGHSWCVEATPQAARGAMIAGRWIAFRTEERLGHSISGQSAIDRNRRTTDNSTVSGKHLTIATLRIYDIMEELFMVALYASPLAAIAFGFEAFRKSKKIRRLESRIEKLHAAEKSRMAEQIAHTQTMGEVVRLLKVQTKYLKSMTASEKTFS